MYLLSPTEVINRHCGHGSSSKSRRFTLSYLSFKDIQGRLTWAWKHIQPPIHKLSAGAMWESNPGWSWALSWTSNIYDQNLSTFKIWSKLKIRIWSFSSLNGTPSDVIFLNQAAGARDGIRTEGAFTWLWSKAVMLENMAMAGKSPGFTKTWRFTAEKIIEMPRHPDLIPRNSGHNSSKRYRKMWKQDGTWRYFTPKKSRCPTCWCLGFGGVAITHSFWKMIISSFIQSYNVGPPSDVC